MKRFIKRLLIVLTVLVVLAGAVAAVVFYYAGQAGSGTIEKWIASQLQTIANGYLNPKLSFEDLDFQLPGTVKLKNLKLTAEDPRNPGTTVDILGAADATVTLAEVPSIGKPIVIEKISLNRPLIQAVATAPGENRFIGFSGMVKQYALDAAKTATTRPGTEEGKQARKKLSDVLQMRLVELIDGRIVYDPRIQGTEPMVLDQINTRLDVLPDEGGAYAVKVALRRQPLFDFEVGMKLNLDTMYAKDVRINLTAALMPDRQSYLPPQLQKVLKEHDAYGELYVRVRGELPLAEYQKGDVLATVQLTDANLRTGEYRIPIKQLDLQTKLTQGKVLLPILRVKALRGELAAGGEMTLNDGLDSIFAVQVANLQLDDLFVNPHDPNDPKLAGRLNAGVNVVVPLKAVLPHLRKKNAARQPVMASTSVPQLPTRWGEGELHLDHGRVVKIPVLDDITKLMAGGRKGRAVMTESADVLFHVGEDKLRITDFRYIGDLAAARGTGTISLDQQLDLVVNGGPVEKVQSLLGKDIGGAIGRVTDELYSYRVTGPLDDPSIRPQAGGTVAKFGEGAVDRIGQGARDVGKGAGDLFKGLFNRD
jgi:hypothetical protein